MPVSALVCSLATQGGWTGEEGQERRKMWMGEAGGKEEKGEKAEVGGGRGQRKQKDT